MNGWDFSVLWQAGQAVLSGQDPYQVNYFYYPLPFAYLCAFLAIFPEKVAFWGWITANVALLVYIYRRKFWQWMLYLPVLHMLSSGQVDLAFWGLERAIRTTWLGAFLAALITLKPQTALLLLPWHLVNWFRHDRIMLLRWSLITGLIWGLPLLWRPGWIGEWFQATQGISLSTASNSPGLFSLLRFWPAVWPLLVFVAGLVALWGVLQNKETARACMVLGSPVGLYYSTMALLGCAPAVWMTPLSLLAAGLSILTKTFIPFMLLPLAVLAWQAHRRRIESQQANTR